MTTPLTPQFLDAVASATDERGWTTDPATIAPHAAEGWAQSRGRTHLLLRPATTEEVSALVRACREHRVPIVPQGGNTGVVGGGVPDLSGRMAIMSLSRMNRVRAVDPVGDTMTVEAGVVLETVHEVAARHERMFPLSLGAQGSCQIGGNVATNAGGIQVLRYGMTRSLVLGLEVVLADGRVWNGLRALRKDNTGYDLKQLFVGSEGTLGIVTAAVLRLVPQPRQTCTAWLAVPSPEAALQLLAICREHLGEALSAVELMSDPVVQRVVDHLPDARRPVSGTTPWHVIVEAAWSLDHGLDERFERVLADALTSGAVTDGTVAGGADERRAFWRIRESPPDAFAAVGAVLRHDVAVPVAAIPTLLARGTELLESAVPGAQVVAFGHLGDGNIHFNLLQPPDVDRDAFRAREGDVQVLVYDLVDELGGSISAEHGVGRLKRDELARRKPALDLELMRRLKAALDPDDLLNPGAVL